jgi:hypothetical protein
MVLCTTLGLHRHFSGGMLRHPGLFGPVFVCMPATVPVRGRINPVFYRGILFWFALRLNF